MRFIGSINLSRYINFLLPFGRCEHQTEYKVCAITIQMLETSYCELCLQRSIGLSTHLLQAYFPILYLVFFGHKKMLSLSDKRNVWYIPEL